MLDVTATASAYKYDDGHGYSLLFGRALFFKSRTFFDARVFELFVRLSIRLYLGKCVSLVNIGLRL